MLSLHVICLTALYSVILYWLLVNVSRYLSSPQDGCILHHHIIMLHFARLNNICLNIFILSYLDCRLSPPVKVPMLSRGFPCSAYFSFTALFMFRGLLEGIPDNCKDDFVDTDPKCIEKVKKMKTMIKAKFPVRIFHKLFLYVSSVGCN